MKKMFFIFLFLSLFFSKNQAANLKGQILGVDNAPLKYFTVAILSFQDSSIIMGGAFTDGYFEFQNIKKEKYLLQISCVGYQTVTRQIDFSKNNSKDIGTVQMNTLELDEVTILAKHPTFRQVEGKLIIDVKGTDLSEAGNLFDALKRSPGLIVDNENKISVLGKGTPVIYIDKREVQNKAEIESLQSDDIASIEIDRNPSVEYSASGKAVLRITTTKTTKEQINLQLYNRSYFARKYRNLSVISLNNRVGKNHSFVSYSYGNHKYKILEKTYETNHQKTYVIDNRSDVIRYSNKESHNLFVSVNQEINSKSNIGFQYSYISNDRDQESQADQRINKTDEEEVKRNVLNDIKRDNNVVTFNLNYELIIDSLSALSVIGDYSEIKDNVSENINEYNNANDSNLKTLIHGKNGYDIYSGKVDYKTRILKSVKLKSGVKLSKVKNDGTAVSTDQNSNMENFKIADQIDERISAAYFTLNKKFKSLNLKTGLRYEYTDTDIRADGISVLDSTYTNWFPSFLINYKFPDQLDATLSYTKKIDRPRFDELSTNITYFDALSYSVGNPEVKPTFIHSIDLTLGLLKGLSINLGYKHENNARILGAVNDDVNPDIVKYTPVNIKNAEYLFANIDYNYSGKKLNSSISLFGQKPFIEIPYLGDYRKVRKFFWHFQTYNDFSITGKTSVLAKFSYSSSRESLMTYFDKMYILSLGLNTSFFEKTLKISLLANDILNSSGNAWEDKYGNIIAGLDSDYDNTWVRFSIKYNFNDFKGISKKKSANESELNRL